MFLQRFLLLSFLAYHYSDATTTESNNYNDAHSHRQGDETCGTTRKRLKRHDRILFPRRPPSSNKYGNALEFNKGQVICYLKLENPSKAFGVDFWMKPEGGQNNPAVVLGVFDKCAAEHETRGWFISLSEASGSSDLRITFTLHTASAYMNTSIMSHRKIDAQRWVHVAATYDGRQMKLYVNQAKVAVGKGQKGMVFERTSQGQPCDQFEIGGDVNSGYFYRGQIDKLRYWNDAISHRELTASLPDNTVDHLMEKTFLYDDFDNENLHSLNWVPTVAGFPRFVRSTVPEEKHDLSIRTPPCGMTICDNPEIVRGYLNNIENRGHKRLRLRVINVMEDNGRRPTVTDDEIQEQYELVQDVFARYNISWELEILPFRDTWLRGKTVLHNCATAQVGDGTCNLDCSYDITGNDGGDCDGSKAECPLEKRGNGKCDPECNKGLYDWDEGDCCNTNAGKPSKTCFDPKSPNKVYLSVSDYKKRIGLDNRKALNVYIANWRDKKLQGFATFPWEKSVHTETGGIVLPPSHFRMKNNSKVLIHELGHVLGLWHVHHGVSEMDCANDCFESFPSLELGDLCEDTIPTIKNFNCCDPEPSEATCGLPHYHKTPFKNFMGYADDSCTDEFTPHQVARMHCYIDQDYQSWQTNSKPSFIPLPPRITSLGGTSIQLSWIPPLGSGGNNAENLCNECEENKVLEQYASTAYSPTPSKPTGNNAPHQATGFPDAEHCTASPLSWRPATVDPVSIPVCPTCLLFIEVGFKEAVIPTAISIWVSWEAHNAFSNIELIYTDGTVESIGNGTAQCDNPFTKPLYVKKMVSKVRIHVARAAVSIDAVKLTSGVGHPNCSKCEPLHYVITRKPPFDFGPETRVHTTRYEDQNIVRTGRYKYRVRAVTNDDLSGPFSPPLIYQPEKGFCGDGKIDEGEQCDDGNVRDGDGCNVQCQLEDVFRCNGRPSLCYRHDGDGVCEEFEKTSSIKDCGFFTPDGFKDQWVHRAKVNPKYKMFDEYCPVEVIMGPPRPDLKCESDDFQIDGKCADSWCPMYITGTFKNWYETKDLWIEVSFKRPTIASAIIVYLGHITVSYPHDKPPKISFKLMDSSRQTKMTLEHILTKFCKQNPVTVPIHHDMSKQFFKTQHIKLILSSDNIGIAAVSLRSPSHFDPVELQNCESTELFNPRIQQCHQYKCNLPECSKLIVKHGNKIKCKKGKREGDVCNVQCEKGFTPREQFQAVCIGGKWLVDGEQALCTPVDCGLPMIRSAKSDCPDGTTFGKKCFFKCNKLTKLVGSGTDPTITCEEDGLWSAPNMFCRRRCLLPQIPANAVTRSKICVKSKVFDAGYSCKYQCINGYMATGFRADSLFMKTCRKDGKWSGPKCTPIRCPITDETIFKWFNCSSGNFYGSVCKLQCPDQQNNREVRCQADGKWNKKFQLCLTEGTCQLPVNPLEGPVFNCNVGLESVNECRVNCPEGSEPGIKLKSKRQRLDSIECSPMFKWHPDPSTIKCLMKCDMKSINDTYCDGKNNNEDCGWDGGDCCDSTADLAFRSLELCGDNCSCQDPNAHDFDGSGL